MRGNSRRGYVKAIVILLLSVGVGWGGYLIYKKITADKPSAAVLPPVVVTAHTVKIADHPMPLEYVGKTVGVREVEVRSRVQGILIKRSYREGGPVRAGQLMFVIDPAPYKATLDRAVAAQHQQKVYLDRAKIEFDRVTGLFEKKAVSQADRDDAVANYNSAAAQLAAAEAAVQQAKIDLDWTRVTAPVSGLSSKETRSEGNLITQDAQGSLLTTIVQLSPLYIDFAVPSDEHRRNERMKAEGVMLEDKGGVWVTASLSDGTKFETNGKINFADRQVDPATSSIKYRASFPNKDGALMPGQFARVVIHGNVLKNIIMLPQRSVIQTQAGPIVYVLQSGDIPEPRSVDLSLSVEDSYMVTRGLTEGERVVVDGTLKVRAGAPVMIQPPASADKAP